MRDRKGEAVQPEEIYTIFLNKLENVLPKKILDEAVLDSFNVKKGMMKRGKNTFSGFFNGNNSKKKTKKNALLADENEFLENKDLPHKSVLNENENFSFGFAF